MSLVKAWLKHYTDRGLQKSAALDAINGILGTKYQHGHLSRWVRGEREPDTKARAEMMRIVVADELSKHLAPREIRRLLDKLT